MKTKYKVAVLDGQKTLIINERLILTKSQVEDEIKSLDDRIRTELPAAKASLNAELLLKQAEEEIGRRITRTEAAKAELESILKELKKK